MVKKPISSKGRRKIEMAKIPNESNLQVTFSKRRSGLFKKASELCTLCGVEIAVVVFSPAKKPFSFGHPAVDPIIDRFLTSQKNSSMKYPISDNYNNNNNNQMIFEPNLSSRSVIIHELNVKLTQLDSELEAEKKRGQVFDDQGKSQSQSHCWWESPVDELSLSELEVLKASLEELKNKVNLTREAHKIASDHQLSTARFPQFSVMNGGRSADGVFDYKPMDDLVARNSASTLREAPNFGFGNQIF